MVSFVPKGKEGERKGATTGVFNTCQGKREEGEQKRERREERKRKGLFRGKRERPKRREEEEKKALT